MRTLKNTEWGAGTMGQPKNKISYNSNIKNIKTFSNFTQYLFHSYFINNIISFVMYGIFRGQVQLTKY